MAKKAETSPVNRKTALSLRLKSQTLAATTLLGVTGFGILKRKELLVWARDHPFAAVGSTIAFASLVWLGAFLKKVWGRVWSREREEFAANALAEWVLTAVSTTVSRFRRRYAEEVCFRHRWFNVRGLRTQGVFKLELEHVFVELRVVPQEFRKASTDPLREGVLPRSWGVWQLLASRQEGLRCLAVVGAPGSGKTTLLQHVALTLARNRQRRHDRRCPPLVPIFLALKDYKETLWKKDAPDLDRLADEAFTTDRLAPPRGWFARRLKAGRCLVLLDGLDEVADEKRRKKVSEWIDRQVERYPKARFLVTSRPHGYRSAPLQSASVFEVQPLTPEQVRRFVEGWYVQNEVMSTGKDDAGVRAEAGKSSSDLLRRLKSSPALARLSVNPLLLTMVAMVHRYRGTLPRRRVELYAEICDVLLGHWQAAKGLDDRLTPAQKRQALQPLALEMMGRAVRECPESEAASVVLPVLRQTDPGGPLSAEEFLRQTEQGSGLILEREAGVYGFAHLTFQEYLAACHLLHTQQEGVLLERVADPWWRETIQLYVAQCDASPVLRACLDLAEASDDPERTVRALTLAHDCQGEALRIDDPELRARLQNLILEGLESDQAGRRRLAADVLFSIRQGNFVRIDEGREIDTGYVSCAEYQSFLDETGAGDRPRHPPHWPSAHVPPGAALKPIAGVRFEDALAYCQWLNERARARGEVGVRYRLPTPEEARENPPTPLSPTPLFQALHGDDVGCWCDAPDTPLVGLAPRWEQEQEWVVREVGLEDAALFGCITEVQSGRFQSGEGVSSAGARVGARTAALALTLAPPARGRPPIPGGDRIHVTPDQVLDLARAFGLGLADGPDGDGPGGSGSAGGSLTHDDIDVALDLFRGLRTPRFRGGPRANSAWPARWRRRLAAAVDVCGLQKLGAKEIVELSMFVRIGLNQPEMGTPSDVVIFNTSYIRSNTPYTGALLAGLGRVLGGTALAGAGDPLPGDFGDYAGAFCYYVHDLLGGSARAGGLNRSRSRALLARLFRKAPEDDSWVPRQRERLLRLHHALTVIAERRAGNLPALEGIRLVRATDAQAPDGQAPAQGRPVPVVRRAQVLFEYGLDLNECVAVVNLATGFGCDIRIRSRPPGGEWSSAQNAKSILDLSLLAADQGSDLMIEASGDGAAVAARSVAEIFRYHSLHDFREAHSQTRSPRRPDRPETTRI